MTFSKFQFIVACTLAFSLLVLTGCDTIGNSETDETTGQLSVELTDAPGDILKANVTITRVAIVPRDDTPSGDSDEGGIEVLSEDSISVDLVQLQDGVTETLGEIEIPAGSYSQIRLVTAREATVYYEDAEGMEQEATLMLPSAGETGIKINFEAFTIDDGQDEVEVLLDFNVEESFVKAGASGTYIFKPVVKAKSVSVNGQTTEGEES